MGAHRGDIGLTSIQKSILTILSILAASALPGLSILLGSSVGSEMALATAWVSIALALSVVGYAIFAASELTGSIPVDTVSILALVFAIALGSTTIISALSIITS